MTWDVPLTIAASSAARQASPSAARASVTAGRHHELASTYPLAISVSHNKAPSTLFSPLHKKHHQCWSTSGGGVCHFLFFSYHALDSNWSSACSLGWWLMACAGLFWEKSTAGSWLISQTNRALLASYRTDSLSSSQSLCGVTNFGIGMNSRRWKKHRESPLGFDLGFATILQH
jgi:hypothetical protein